MTVATGGAIANALLEGLPCWGNISPPGTVGLTERNSAAYPYDPARAKQLLKEANYDPANQITIYTHTGYCCRNLEFQEAVVQYWTEVGVNAELQIVDTTWQKEITSSGCGRFANEASYKGVWDCAQRDAQGPNFASYNATVTNTSNEMLDTQVQAGRRLVRFNRDGTTLALSHKKIAGRYHNKPKDLVVDSQERIWFWDPHGDLWDPKFTTNWTMPRC